MTTTRAQHLIGKELGSCLLERVIAYGGSSAVFLAQQHHPDRKVAVKVFLPDSAMDKQMQKDFYYRFLSETKAASQLDHPNILPIYSYGEQDGLPYIIMPYMDGGTLRQRIAKYGHLSLREAQWYLEQIAPALDYAHEHGCVHCDVKPANILLTSDGQVMLADFGIAHMMRSDATTGRVSTKSPAALMGTPDYISPEQAMGKPLDGRSDIYSLGITLYFLLAGTLPFRAESAIALALMHIHELPPSLVLISAEASPEIDSVIHKALAKNPEDRFQTAKAFREAFDNAIALSDSASENTHSVAAPYTLLASPPTVRIKPTRHRPTSTRFSRLLVLSVLLIALISGIVGTAGWLALSGIKGVSILPGKISSVPGNSKALADALADTDNWPLGNTFFFTGQQYHIQNMSSHYIALALYSEHQFANFHLTVTVSQLRGSRDGADYYGIIFRSSDDQSHYYLFEIAAWGGGQFQFSRYDGQWTILAGGPVSSLRTGRKQSNTITVQAKGHTFVFLVNGVSVGTLFTDSSKHPLSVGEIGFCVEEQGTEVAFSHLYIETLK